MLETDEDVAIIPPSDMVWGRGFFFFETVVLVGWVVGILDCGLAGLVATFFARPVATAFHEDGGDTMDGDDDELAVSGVGRLMIRTGLSFLGLGGSSALILGLSAAHGR